MGGVKSGVPLLCPKCLRLRELICVSISCGSVMVRHVTQVLGSSVGSRGVLGSYKFVGTIGDRLLQKEREIALGGRASVLNDTVLRACALTTLGI